MKLSVVTLALLSVVYGYNISDINTATTSPTSSALKISGVETLINDVNSGVVDLNNLFSQAIADNHLTAEFVSSYIDNIDQSIESVTTDLENALQGYSLDLKKTMAKHIIAPYFNTVVSGAQTLVSNLGKVEGTVNSKYVAEITVNYQKLIDFGKFANIDTSKLEQLSRECNGSKQHNYKRATEAEMSGVHGAINNMKETLDTLKHEATTDTGHNAAASITALITGLDGQIDNLAATILDGLNGVTFGLSGDLGDFLLGPIFQGVTNGAQVIFSNIVGGSIDMVADGTVTLFSQSMTKLVTLGKQLNLKAKNLELVEDANKQWISLKTTMKDRANNGTDTTKREKRATESEMAGIHGAINNMKETINTLKHEATTDTGHNAAASITALITGLDGQIDNLAATILDGLNGVTLGLSGDLGDFLLGPIFQGLTNGAQVLISNVIGGSIDMVSDSTAMLFSQSMTKLVSLGKQLNLKAKNLELVEDANKQWTSLQETIKKTKLKAEASAKSKRATEEQMSGIHGAINNMKETLDTLKHEATTDTGHNAAASITALITGLDGQIDNLAATILDGLNGVTFGLSGDLGDFLLGPIFQGVTNGAQVIFSNIVGGSIDMVADGTVTLFSQSMTKLVTLGKQLNLKAKNLELVEDANKQWTSLKSTMEKKEKKADATASHA